VVRQIYGKRYGIRGRTYINVKRYTFGDVDRDGSEIVEKVEKTV